MTTATTYEEAVRPCGGGSRIAWAFSDARVLAGRYVRHILRQPEEIATAVLIPTVLMLMFRYMLGGAVDAGGSSYANFLVPGILAIGVTLISVSTTVGVFLDMQEGFVDRLRSMSTLATSVVIGHIVAAVMRALIGLVVLTAIGFAVGFRPSAGVLQYLAAFALLMLFAVAVGWISALFGQLARSTEGASGLALTLTFLPYASNVFAPTETMSPGLRVFVEHQPVTAVIDAVRALLLDQPVGNAAWIAVLWWGGIIALAVPLSNRLFRRRFS
ncbi:MULTISPECIES: ABC transporter permease [Streptomyces]|uniref:Transport permease protein n=1 Tax=Streptomyces ardesiacus TaxID=285564 RepID=A0ABW8HG45_9ACTN|nr:MULTISPECIES: ABC transporter permease [Streptomyces]NEB58163.1 ABC transporter permease [Streptomyces diastaticus]KOT96803.1 multidrug ABC transporter permease [Streptomyces sp. NRRL F-4711]KOX34675.1 multidrug ABC transporter permease [Streptomyces sp. NRRL F-4707]KOX46709.1 multidrug ABC transporter permease [Streptomyces sp. NRRL F-7442]MCL7370141.1 ABC transporter permease [Streptomyces ardesiacus]